LALAIEAAGLEPLRRQTHRHLANVLAAACATGEQHRLVEGDGHPLGTGAGHAEGEGTAVVADLAASFQKEDEVEVRARFGLGSEVVQFQAVRAVQRQPATQSTPAQVALEQPIPADLAIHQANRIARHLRQFTGADDMRLAAHAGFPPCLWRKEQISARKPLVTNRVADYASLFIDANHSHYVMRLSGDRRCIAGRGLWICNRVDIIHSSRWLSPCCSPCRDWSLPPPSRWSCRPPKFSAPPRKSSSR